MVIKDVELEQRKLNKLKIIIIGMTRENLKTKEITKTELRKRISRAIEREVLD